MLIYINNYITKSKHTKHLIKNLPGVQHYKQKSRIFGSQSRLRDSKLHNNALHAFCGMEERNINFIHYKENLYKNWRRNLLIIDTTLALSVLIIQCLTYISLLGTNERAVLKLHIFCLELLLLLLWIFFLYLFKCFSYLQSKGKYGGGIRQAFRYGGEEYVLLFEDSMQAPVLHLVDGIRSAFENKVFRI